MAVEIPENPPTLTARHLAANRRARDGMTYRERAELALSGLAGGWGREARIGIGPTLNGLAVVSMMVDELIRSEVTEAREAGASWTEIGEALGISKQAAQQRFTVKAS
ncbi:MAG: hypothetical protein ACTHW7_15110 [Actinomycetaceae bacterium]